MNVEYELKNGKIRTFTFFTSNFTGDLVKELIKIGNKLGMTFDVVDSNKFTTTIVFRSNRWCRWLEN